MLSSNVPTSQSRYLAPHNNNNTNTTGPIGTMQNTTTNSQHPSGGLGLSAQNNLTSMSSTNSVPTGLLLSGPTSALLHNNSSTGAGGASSVGGTNTTTTLPSVPVVASPKGMNQTMSGNSNTGNLTTSTPTTNTPASMNPMANMGANMYHKQG